MPSAEANRRNANKSTGPRTPEGKAAVRLNSLSHGAFAADLLLPGEPSEPFRALEAGFRRDYQPNSDAEHFLVERMVLAAWRLQRLAAMENRVLLAHSGLHAERVAFIKSLHDLRSDAESEPETAPSDPLALAWIRDTTNGNAMVKLARYQTALERSFYRALHELERLRA